MSFISVNFTCHGPCGLQAVKVVVPVRKEGQDIKEWVDMAAAKCGERHFNLAPTCREGKVDMAFPMPKEGDGLGMSAAPGGEMKGVPEFMKSKGAN
jgi:hypothetical protein